MRRRPPYSCCNPYRAATWPALFRMQFARLLESRQVTQNASASWPPCRGGGLLHVYPPEATR